MLRRVSPWFDSTRFWIAVSLVFHGVAALGLALLAGAARPDRPVEKVVTVELMTPAQFAALSGPGGPGGPGEAADTDVPALAPPPPASDPPDAPPDALRDAGPAQSGAGAPGGMIRGRLSFCRPAPCPIPSAGRRARRCRPWRAPNA